MMPVKERTTQRAGRIVSLLFWAALITGLAPLLFHSLYCDDYDLVLIGGRDMPWEFFVPGHGDVAYHYNPFRLTTFAAIRAMAGHAPWAYHLLSLAAQIACVAAWIRIGERLCSAWAIRLALASVFCFLTLPSEAVFWVGANDQLIGTTAYLWSTWTYTRFVERSSRIHLAISIFLFCIGAATIEFVASLPLLLLMISLWPRALGIGCPRMASIRPLVPFGALLLLYLIVHTVSVNMERILVTEHFSPVPGSHTIRNLGFAVDKVVFGSTYFHRLSPMEAWDAAPGSSWNPVPHIVAGLLLMGGFWWRRTRILATWLVLTLLPYVLRPGPAVESRYYHLPAAVFLLGWLPVLDAITRRRMARTILGCGLVVYFSSVYQTWSSSHHTHYLSIGDHADSELQRILANAPDPLTNQTSLLIFNQLPRGLNTVTSAVGDSWTDDLGYRVPTRHFCDWEAYRFETGGLMAAEGRWHIGLGRVLIGQDRRGDEHAWVCPPQAAAVRGDSAAMVWDVKPPFPGFLVWRVAQGTDLGAPPHQGMRLIIEEYAEADRAGAHPLRSEETRIDAAQRRIRLPRQLDNTNWTRITLGVPPEVESEVIEYLALETP